MRKILLSICSYFLIQIIVFPQTKEFVVSEFTVDDGISQSVPTALIQDNFGFIWIGTEDGLNRFDGYSFKHFFNDPLDPNSLCNNFITALMQDSKDRIWIGTRNGLSVFDPRRELFFSFTTDNDDSTSLNSSIIVSLFESALGEIYIGTSTGLNIAIDDEEEITSIRFTQMKTSTYPDENTILSSAVNSISEDQNKNIWLAHQTKESATNADIGSLTRYDPVAQKFYHYYLDDIDSEIKSSAVRSLYCDKKNLWVGTFSEGLIKIEFENDGTPAIKNIFNSQTSPNKISHDYIGKILKSEDGIIIGTYNGISALDLKENTTSDVQLFNKRRERLDALTINDLLQDCSGNLWIASVKGLFKYSPSSQNFQSFIYNPTEENSIIGGDIFGIKEDSRGNIWAASFGSGLTKLIPIGSGQYKTERYSREKNNLISNQILRISEDNENNIWLATFNGLVKIIDDKTGDFLFKNFTPENSGLTTIYYYDLFFNSAGWFAARTYQSGIDLVSIENGDLKVKNYKYTFSEEAKDKIISCFGGNQNELWIVTNSSIVLGNFSDSFELKFIPLLFEKQYWDGISKLIFNHIQRADENTLLIGTNNGLLRVDLSYFNYENFIEAVDIKMYNINNGLPNNTIYAITKHNDDSFWLSTNKGISNFSLEKESFTNYEITSGINLNEFNAGAVDLGKNGHIYFGGIGGFIRFHPDSLLQSNTPPPIVINEISLFNKSLEINASEKSILKESVLYISELEFSHSDNMISIAFSALNFDEPYKNTYAYMLDGFHNDWVNSGKIRYATFTNLDDGEYTFRVKAANKDGIWSDNAASLKIIINPPPWDTWWAYLLYATLFLSGVFFVFWSREQKYRRTLEIEKRIDAAKSEERKKVRTEISQDFHDEAGNKITKINLFTTLAQRKADDAELKGFLDKIQENTKELSMGMRDFLWVLDVGKDSLFDMIKRIEEFGNSMFEMSEISFRVAGIEDSFKNISLPMHARRSLILIFKEALNNSMKYSLAENVIFSVSLEDSELTLFLEDDGKGFAASGSAEGYGLKNMVQRAEKLKGKLEINSVSGGGTKINFTGNITHMSN
ncbi:MAG: hypothetical protein J5I57_11865 [Melioribacteraceae bacterium]|nr:hypothetical protein [Melioribacteraceae bacterium]